MAWGRMNYAALLLFWFVILLTLASAVMVVASKNILHAAFSLCTCFLGVAGIYLFLHADFVAAVQLIVYVGGILVLIMFAIMFSSHTQEERGEGGRKLLALGAGAGVAGMVFTAILLMLHKLSVPLRALNSKSDEVYRFTTGGGGAPTDGDLGYLLMGKYLLPFEVASVLILAALIGAVVIVRKETR